MAFPRIVQDPVLHAVQRIALGQHRIGNRRNLRRRNVAARRRRQRQRVHGRGRQQRRPVIRRRPGQYAVVILGKPLRLHQRFAAAVGAGCKVGVLCARTIELLHHGLRGNRHFVDAAIAEIGHLLRMPQRPACVDERCRVARVRARCRIALGDRRAQILVSNRSGKAAIAVAEQLSVPSLERHPDLDRNVGIGRRMRMNHDSAERRQFLVERSRALAGKRVRWRVECAGCHLGGHGDRSVGQVQAGKPLARATGWNCSVCRASRLRETNRRT